MALLKCDDCGGVVSSLAPACPHCGRPSAGVPRDAAAPTSPQQKPLPSPISTALEGPPATRSDNSSSLIGKLLLVGACIALAVGVGTYFSVLGPARSSGAGQGMMEQWDSENRARVAWEDSQPWFIGGGVAGVLGIALLILGVDSGAERSAPFVYVNRRDDVRHRLTAGAVAARVSADPEATHLVWRSDLGRWTDPRAVEEIERHLRRA